MNYETATNDDLEVKLAELLGMDSLSALNAPKYCTDWNATMPIAIENNIYIEPRGLRCGGNEDSNHIAIGDRCGAWDLDPLRAIVICLVKTLENENDSGQK
ncbi:hypothetical protein [Vibrio paracholerae]|uniref:hypothetical protein n=1 Tax=Vibrio paracholerae TaxID=650003 RepID=UPI002095C979|nr:hypothetical protein [Vibrio paracholerae]MCO7020311.1 hypothetical protein [Vibrio paracholerae]